MDPSRPRGLSAGPRVRREGCGTGSSERGGAGANAGGAGAGSRVLRAAVRQIRGAWAGKERRRMFREVRGPQEVPAGGAISRTLAVPSPPSAGPSSAGPPRGGERRAGFRSPVPRRRRKLPGLRESRAGPAPRTALHALGSRSGAAGGAGGHVGPARGLLPAGAEQDGVGGAAAAAGAAPGGLRRLRLRLVGAERRAGGGAGAKPSARPLPARRGSQRAEGPRPASTPDAARISRMNGGSGGVKETFLPDAARGQRGVVLPPCPSWSVLHQARILRRHWRHSQRKGGSPRLLNAPARLCPGSGSPGSGRCPCLRVGTFFYKSRAQLGGEQDSSP